MPEKFFEGFEFRSFQSQKPILIDMNPAQKANNSLGETNIMSPLELLQNIDPFEISEVEFETWNSYDLMEEFAAHLDRLDSYIGNPRLTMKKRTMKFVTPEDMRPQNEAEKQWLIKRYGRYIEGGGAGDCYRLDDGTFTLRIGFAGKENEISKSEVLSVMGHEYGHTLGKHIDDSIHEELKAYAFANLYLKHFYNVDEYRVIGMEASNVHETAFFWLEQLLDKGIKEEVILAHLTGKRFGNSYPNDYMK